MLNVYIAEYDMCELYVKLRLGKLAIKVKC